MDEFWEYVPIFDDLIEKKLQRIRQEVQKEVQAQALQESIMTALEAHFDGVNGKIARISLNTVVNALQKAKPTAKRNAAKA